MSAALPCRGLKETHRAAVKRVGIFTVLLPGRVAGQIPGGVGSLPRRRGLVFTDRAPDGQGAHAVPKGLIGDGRTVGKLGGDAFRQGPGSHAVSNVKELLPVLSEQGLVVAAAQGIEPVLAHGAVFQKRLKNSHRLSSLSHEHEPAPVTLPAPEGCA